MKQDRGRSVLSLALVALLLVLILTVLAFPAMRGLASRDNLLALVDLAGGAAPFAFMAIMALAVVISPIPNVPITAVLGMVYGPWIGTAVASGGAIIGAVIAFVIARRLGQRAIVALTGKEVRFCNGCSNRTISVIVFVARLIPAVSFDLVSYGAGLTTLPLWKFTLWSYVGMLPWTWIYTAFGATLFDSPALGLVLGIVLAVVVLGLPSFVKKFNPFGLRRVLMEQEGPDQQ